MAMLAVNKNTDEVEFSAYLITPSFKINSSIKQLDGSIQKNTFLNIPCIFNLTYSKNLFIVNICLVFGIGFKLKIKEKK